MCTYYKKQTSLTDTSLNKVFSKHFIIYLDIYGIADAHWERDEICYQDLITCFIHVALYYRENRPLRDVDCFEYEICLSQLQGMEAHFDKNVEIMIS